MLMKTLTRDQLKWHMGSRNEVLIIKNAIDLSIIEDAFLVLQESSFGYTSKYMGQTQMNWGVRNSNVHDSPYLRKEWVKSLYDLSNSITRISHAFREVVTSLVQKIVYLPGESGPVFHGIYNSLDSGGAHVDTAQLDYSTAYLKRCYTAITYLSKPEVGGRIIFYDKFGSAYYPNVSKGDMIIFDSTILHDIEQFDGKKDFFSRVSMVCQYKELEYGVFTEFV